MIVRAYTISMRSFLSRIIIILIAIICFFFSLSYGMTALNWMHVSISDAKTISEILQSFVQIIAIIIAGLWTYERFIKNREDYPYPKIEQRCEHYVLEKNIIYLSVFVTVTNQGKTKLDLNGAVITVRQVSPLSDEIKERLKKTLKNSRDKDIRRGNVEDLFVDQGQRIGWITLGQREWNRSRGKINELEPGQTREFQFDFLLLEDDVKVIEAISSFKNEKFAWELGTLYSLIKSDI
jgi:hypothetical protein